MKGPTRFWGGMVAWTAALLIAPITAWGAGLAYRDVSTGLWKGIAATGDVRAGGVFAGRVFAGFNSPVKASIDAVPAGPCGAAASVAAFSARVVGAAPNSGLFLYDGVTDSIFDAVIAGAVTPIGGTWVPFVGVNPAVAIDPVTCLIHVVFPGRAAGVGGAIDTGIFDATFGPLPGFAPAGVATIAHEGLSVPPAPFPGGSLFANFPTNLHVAAKGDPAGGGFTAAFRGQVFGGGVTGANNTGVFAFGTILGPVTTAAREGDVACPPPFGGTMFGDFPPPINIGVGDVLAFFGPQVVFVARSNAPPASDTAILSVLPALGCGGGPTLAMEGAGAPFGGTYTNFQPTTRLTAAGGGGSSIANLAFVANVTGGLAPRGLFYSPFGGAPVTVVAQGQPGTALGAGAVSIPGSVEPALNASGTLAFRAVVAGAGPGLFSYSGAPAESLGGGFRGAQIDRLGNVTAHFP